MSNGIVRLPPDSTGKMIDAEELTVGANTVERQRMQIAGAAAADIAPVSATNGVTVDVVDKAARDLGKVDIAGLDQYTPVNNRLPVVLTTSGGGAVEPITEPAHGAADDANGPAKIGGRAVSARPTAVSDAQRVNAYFDLYGQLHVVAEQGKTLKSVSASYNTSGDQTVVSAVASKKLTIYAVSITTKADISAGLTAKFTDGAAGTQMWAVDALVPATQSWGAVETVAPPNHLFQLTTNTALVLNLSAAKACQVNIAYWEE